MSLRDYFTNEFVERPCEITLIFKKDFFFK